MTYPASEGDLVNGAAPEGEPLRAVGELLPQRLRRDQRARQDLRGERRPSPEHAIAASDAATTASTIGIIRIGIGIGATTAKGVRGRQQQRVAFGADELRVYAVAKRPLVVGVARAPPMQPHVASDEDPRTERVLVDRRALGGRGEGHGGDGGARCGRH